MYWYVAYSVALHPQGDIPDTPGARVRLLSTNSKAGKSLGSQTSQVTREERVQSLITHVEKQFVLCHVSTVTFQIYLASFPGSHAWTRNEAKTYHEDTYSLASFLGYF